MGTDWGALLTGQLEFYWNVHLRPRLAGLTDDEYLWEPAPDSWSVRQDVTGAWVLDGAEPPPEPAPVTTIAWRLIHVAAGMATRASAFFEWPDGADAGDMFDPRHRPARLPGTADGALRLLDLSYERWHGGLAALGRDGWARPLGPRGAGFADEPMAALVVHVNREVMHHGGEICLLRDLYRAR